MKYRLLKLMWEKDGYSTCDGCNVGRSDNLEHRVWTEYFEWLGYYCGKCVARLDVICDYYLVVDGLGTYSYIYHDMELLRTVRPELVPKLVKI
jgi:Cys-tRNA synthase (O-phospho-L-seryl-tRNA:Cys-tRNA synthase)